MKACSKCKLEKPKTEFYKAARLKDGLRPECKDCAGSYRREYVMANKFVISERNRKYYDANRDRAAEYGREYRESNPEKVAKAVQKWREANPGKASARTREWQANNPDAVAANNRKRRARKIEAEGSHTADDVKEIFERQLGICASCPAILIRAGKGKYHIDHIMPLSKGGSDWPSNLQCLCPECNTRKGAKTPEEWARINGKLI